MYATLDQSSVNKRMTDHIIIALIRTHALFLLRTQNVY